MKYGYVFQTAEGKKFVGHGKDADRAKVNAKAKAVAEGHNWSGARLVGLTNAIQG